MTPPTDWIQTTSSIEACFQGWPRMSAKPPNPNPNPNPITLTLARPARRAADQCGPRKEWSATEDELIRNGVAQMGYKWRVLGAPRPLTLTLTPNPNPNPNPEPNPTPTPTLTLTLTL